MRKHTKSIVPKKLELSTQTVRDLDAPAMRVVAGASGNYKCGTFWCPDPGDKQGGTQA